MPVQESGSLLHQLPQVGDAQLVQAVHDTVGPGGEIRRGIRRGHGHSFHAAGPRRLQADKRVFEDKAAPRFAGDSAGGELV